MSSAPHRFCVSVAFDLPSDGHPFPMRAVIRLLKLLLLGTVIAGAAYTARETPSPRLKLAERSGPALSSAQNWGYQLQHARADLIAPNIDMVVVDYARDGRDETAWTRAQVDSFRKRQDGSQRIVLAYMSIGEAENYLLLEQNRTVVVGHQYEARVAGARKSGLAGELPGALLAARLAEHLCGLATIGAGSSNRDASAVEKALHRPHHRSRFDGVYLDRVDAFQEWSKERSTAETDMVAFVARLTRYAKSRRPGFLVVAQNGEELLRRADYRRLIDGIAKEDLFYGVDGAGKENSKEDINRTILMLNRATADKLPVFIVEYVSDRAAQISVANRAAALGYLPHFASRELNRAPEAAPR